MPALANVFYYGKEFGSQKQELTKEGAVSGKRYRPLSVTKAGALGEMLEEQEIAEQAETGENAEDYIKQLLDQQDAGMPLDELLKLIQRG